MRSFGAFLRHIKFRKSLRACELSYSFLSLSDHGVKRSESFRFHSFPDLSHLNIFFVSFSSIERIQFNIRYYCWFPPRSGLGSRHLPMCFVWSSFEFIIFSLNFISICLVLVHCGFLQYFHHKYVCNRVYCLCKCNSPTTCTDCFGNIWPLCLMRFWTFSLAHPLIFYRTAVIPLKFANFPFCFSN